ncbi:MAG: hypothetical protein HC837_09555, partial [Chloroflexaceae bacterium]|nr:hypothetical protein [Chloroflexaceae bacterium]
LLCQLPLVRQGAIYDPLLWLGLPTLAGLAFAAWCWLTQPAQRMLDNARTIVYLVLLTLVGSWFAWYVLLSVGWLRYLFPAIFLGTIFAAAMVINALSWLRSSARRRWPTIAALLALTLFVGTLPFTLATLQQFFTPITSEAATTRLARYINSETPPDALIESYDSEIFFLLERRYHFPPDQLHVELNRRTFLEQDVPITYDPLAADPDYLVVGSFGKLWQLYDPVLASGAFRLIEQIDQYDIYERVR